RADRKSLARSSALLRQLEQRLQTLPRLGEGWRFRAAVRGLLRRAGYGIRHGRCHHRQSPSPRSGRKRGTQNQAIGRSKGGMTTKILALTDALGNLVRFVLLPGHRFDTVGVAPLIDGLAFDGVRADTAFDSDDTTAVERPVGVLSIAGEAVDERGNADRIETMAGQENEAHEIAERIGEGEDLGRHAALGAADGLALSPPFAPWPWRWTLTMVASTMAYSMSGCSEQASKSLMKTSALIQSRYRLKTVFQLPKKGGRSRHGLPVRTIQSTASTKRR